MPKGMCGRTMCVGGGAKCCVFTQLKLFLFGYFFRGCLLFDWRFFLGWCFFLRDHFRLHRCFLFYDFLSPHAASGEFFGRILCECQTFLKRQFFWFFTFWNLDVFLSSLNIRTKAAIQDLN